jgi:hypothetical protein
MKVKLPSIVYLVLFSILINACGKEGCPDSKPIEKGVDKSYLPYIIPYSDTSTRLFLKNGKDTLLFKSQGLKETITNEQAGEGSCDQYNLQQYSLKMAASDTDYFLINYYATKFGSLYNDYEIISGNNYSKSESDLSRDFVNYFPTIEKITILNNSYDSIRNYTNSFGDIFIARPKTGVLKIQTKNVLYELIK